MMSLTPGKQVRLACRPTDMRNGFHGLAVPVSEVLRSDPHSGHGFASRGKRGDYLKALSTTREGPLRVAPGD